tara:strand:- start:3322 stop:3534 length:213 start_codon:yes stop_codon:yes gene_type:complete
LFAIKKNVQRANGNINKLSIKKDEMLATLRIVYDEEIIGEYELLASKEIKKVNIFSRLIKSFNYLIWGDV